MIQPGFFPCPSEVKSSEPWDLPGKAGKLGLAPLHESVRAQFFELMNSSCRNATWGYFCVFLFFGEQSEANPRQEADDSESLAGRRLCIDMFHNIYIYMYIYICICMY